MYLHIMKLCALCKKDKKHIFSLLLNLTCNIFLFPTCLHNLLQNCYVLRVYYLSPVHQRCIPVLVHTARTTKPSKSFLLWSSHMSTPWAHNYMILNRNHKSNKSFPALGIHRRLQVQIMFQQLLKWNPVQKEKISLFLQFCFFFFSIQLETRSFNLKQWV